MYVFCAAERERHKCESDRQADKLQKLRHGLPPSIRIAAGGYKNQNQRKYINGP